MSTNYVTLADGRTVPSDHIDWQQECLVRHNHVANLRGRSLQQRRAYLRELEHAAGAEMALRVIDDYAKDWEARKAAQATDQSIPT